MTLWKWRNPSRHSINLQQPSILRGIESKSAARGEGGFILLYNTVTVYKIIMKSHLKIKCFFEIHWYLLAQLIMIRNGLSNWCLQTTRLLSTKLNPPFLFFLNGSDSQAHKHRGKSSETESTGQCTNRVYFPGDSWTHMNVATGSQTL